MRGGYRGDDRQAEAVLVVQSLSVQAMEGFERPPGLAGGYVGASGSWRAARLRPAAALTRVE